MGIRRTIYLVLLVLITGALGFCIAKLQDPIVLDVKSSSCRMIMDNDSCMATMCILEHKKKVIIRYPSCYPTNPKTKRNEEDRW